MKNRVSTLSKDDLGDLVKAFRIPLNLHPRFPDLALTMDCLPHEAIGVYSESLWFFGVRIPFLTFLLSVLGYFKVVCRDLGIVPTVTLFRVFQCLCKQGDWFSFAKRWNTKDVCMDYGSSSLKKWKNKFFLIDRRAILGYLTRRHSHSYVFDDLPVDGYNQDDIERLCARLIRLREMKEEVLVRSGLSSLWSNRKCDPIFQRKDDNSSRFRGIMFSAVIRYPLSGDAKVVKEPHNHPAPLLEHVSRHTTAPAAKGALILLPTPDEVVAAQPDPRLARRSQVLEVGSSKPEVEQIEGLETWFPPSSSVVAAYELSQIGTSVRVATPVCGVARK
ncbi:hypothetical protein Tco_1142821, partial [Tanacetum coccineum]